MGASITGVGHYLPEKILTNQQLEQMVDTSDEWIIQRTGIKERRICRDDEFTSDLAIKAVDNLQKKSDINLDDVDHIIVATMTADYYCPNVASRIQAHIKSSHAGVIDINVACSGFVYALEYAVGLINSGMNKKVLVIGAEAMSKLVDWKDRTTCILFGDGAAAFLLEDRSSTDFLAFIKQSYGDLGHHLVCNGLSNKLNKGIGQTITQSGRDIYRWVVSNIPKCINELIDKSNLSLTDINWFIPHSANLRIIEAVCDRLNYPISKTLLSLTLCGNTSAASIPLAFAIAHDEGKIKNKDTLILHGFGGGLSQLGIVIKLNNL